MSAKRQGGRPNEDELGMPSSGRKAVLAELAVIPVS